VTEPWPPAAIGLLPLPIVALNNPFASVCGWSVRAQPCPTAPIFISVTITVSPDVRVRVGPGDVILDPESPNLNSFA
jgi:hypothetical protein